MALPAVTVEKPKLLTINKLAQLVTPHFAPVAHKPVNANKSTFLLEKAFFNIVKDDS